MANFKLNVSTSLVEMVINIEKSRKEISLLQKQHTNAEIQRVSKIEEKDIGKYLD